MFTLLSILHVTLRDEWVVAMFKIRQQVKAFGNVAKERVVDELFKHACSLWS